MAGPRIGVCMWPVQPWVQSRELWRRAEDLGFAHAWVYDHIAWRGHTPWFDGYATLTAAAAVTSRIRLGTLVTSPNFRHPVPTAHAARAIDDISGGRLTLGIGAGAASRNTDSGVLGGADWSPRERADRLAEWVELLDLLLRGPETTYEGAYYAAKEVVTGPGCLQQPRVPFAIAGDGPRGMRLTVRYGDTWVTTANPPVAGTPLETAGAHLARLDDICGAERRDPAGLRRLLLTGFTEEPWLASAESFADLAGRYAELGITDIVIHWPRPGTRWAADMKVFEAIAADHAMGA